MKIEIKGVSIFYFFNNSAIYCRDRCEKRHPNSLKNNAKFTRLSFFIPPSFFGIRTLIMKQQQNQETNTMSFTIGADPELVARHNGVFVQANKYFRFNSSFGTDGNSDICEIRPGYCESPIELTAKIKTVLEYGHEKAPDLEFYAGHYVDGYPIGGHIHVSVEPTTKVVNSLDTVLYSLSNCIDDKEQREKRQRTGYGKRFAHRRKDHGFEYRTQGSWLISPAVTLVTFTLTKLAVIAAIDDDIDLNEVKGNIHSNTFLKNIESFIKTIPEDCMEGLTQLKKLLTKPIDWNQNILPNWGISVN